MTRRSAALSAMMIVCAGLSAVVAGGAGAQHVAVSVQVSSDRQFVPLQSYVQGEVDGKLLFFCGLSDMGLHVFGQGAFPAKNFSRQIVMVDRATGAVTTGTTDHLPLATRQAMTVTAPTAVQYGSILYMYGGYGPDLENPGDYFTRALCTAIDLVQVKNALQASQPVPASAFTHTECVAGKVAGAGIVKLGDRFALICGADADGEYGSAPDPEYTNVVQIFDRNVSYVNPVETLDDGQGFFSPMHRRDVNVLPVRMPVDRAGFVVVCGAFESGIFLYENPLIWGEGDAVPYEDNEFIQHIGGYEGPIASLYSASHNRNHLLIFSGLSGYEYIDNEFVWNPAAPWTRQIVNLHVDGGVFARELVLGEMPWPLTNAKLVLENTLPKTTDGQVLVDQLPFGQPILLGRIYGGIAAEKQGSVSPTYASDAVLDVYVTVTPEGPVEVRPSAFSRVRGLHVSGGLSDLLQSDDLRLVTRPDVFRTSAVPPVQIQVVGTSPLQNPSELKFTVESRASANNISQRVRLFNYDTQKWEQVDARTMPLSDTTIVVTISTDPARFIDDATGEMKALLQYNALAFTIAPIWQAGQDLTMWTIVP